MSQIVLLLGKAAVGKTDPGLALQNRGGFIRGVSYDIVIATDTDGSLKKQADAGIRWADELVNRCVMNHLSNAVERDHVLDGFGRSLGQAMYLVGYSRCVGAEPVVIEIDAPDEVCTRRVLQRREDRIKRGLPLRRDDDPVVHAKRMKDYAEYAPPVLTYFRAQHGVRLHRVDGTKPLLEVCDEVMSLVPQPALS